LLFDDEMFIKGCRTVISVGFWRGVIPGGHSHCLVAFVSGAVSTVVPRRTSCFSRVIEKMSIEKKPFHRLPTDVVPSNYAIRLKPDLEKFTFDGHEEIQIEVRCPC